MQLSQDQIKQYHEDGLLVVEAAFSPSEVEVLRDAFRRDSQVPGRHRIAEESSDEVRAVYASHQRQPDSLEWSGRCSERAYESHFSDQVFRLPTEFLP